MAKVRVHQDVFGFKAGQEVDSSDFPDDDAVKWGVGEGYLSTAASRKTDHANEQTAAPLDARPEADGPERTNDPLPPTPNAGLNPAEAFDPTTRTVDEVKTYVKSLPQGAGRDKEVARIKAVEAKGEDREGIASLS